MNFCSNLMLNQRLKDGMSLRYFECEKGTKGYFCVEKMWKRRNEILFTYNLKEIPAENRDSSFQNINRDKQGFDLKLIMVLDSGLINDNGRLKKSIIGYTNEWMNKDFNLWILNKYWQKLCSGRTMN